MKNNFKRLFKAAFLLSFIILTSCEKDLYEEKIAQSTTAKINYVTIEQVPFLIPKIQEFNHSYDYLSSSKSVNKETLNLNLDLNHIIEYIQSNGLKSYSINIKENFQEYDDKYYENLHFYEKNGELISFILKYNPTVDTPELDMKTFTGDIEILNLNHNLQTIAQFNNGIKLFFKITNGNWHIWIHNDGSIDVWNTGDESGNSGGSPPGGVSTTIDGQSSTLPGPIITTTYTGPIPVDPINDVPPVVANTPSQAQLFIQSLDTNSNSDNSTLFYELNLNTQNTILNYVGSNNYVGANVYNARNFLLSIFPNQHMGQ